MKHLLQLIILMVAAMLTVSIAVPVHARVQQNGDTAEEPILISDAAGLAGIKDGLAKHYKLGNDIALTYAEGETWTPIAGAFTGILDGCGYTISGLKVSVTGSNNVGIFETIGTGGTVKNLGVIDGSVTATEGNAGGIAGENNGTIQNCYTNVTVTSPFSAGGIVGVNSYLIQNCYTTGTVTSEKQAGGIAGTNFRMIQNCYTTGAITCEKGKAGGIAGMNMENTNTATIQYCYATGTIKGNQAGGIIGVISTDNTAVTNCIALNKSITGTNTGEYSGVGRIIGYKYEYTATLADNYAALSIPGAWEAADKVATRISGADLPSTFGTDGADAGAFKDWPTDKWDFTTINLPTLQGFKADQPVKNVERAPFLVVPVTTITTQAELATINLSGSYKLGDNITLTGWSSPIGTFTGTLDGDGYVITLTDATASLFSTINADGTVKNLGVKGKVESSTDVGGIARSNSGTIQNCYTSVELICTGSTTSVGGIAGSNSGMIQNCYSTGKITSVGKLQVSGGIAGQNIQGATIQYCYATGTLNGGTNPTAGIASDNTGSVRNCIALNTGGITSSSNYKYRIANSSGRGTNTNNYAALSIPGAWSIKGANAKDGADLTADNFTNVTTATGAFADWPTSGTHDWNLNATDLPSLKGFKADQPVKDMKRAPFLEVPVTTIKDQAGLADIAKDLSGSYKLGGNITLSGNWTPLGDNFNRFTGTLDGCGYIISGLSVSMTEADGTYAGLFGAIGEKGTVKNLGVTGSVTVTTTGTAYVGGIAGYCVGQIMNCYTSVTIDATGTYDTYAGGVVGVIDGDASAISNCFANGNCTVSASISGTAIAGGIVGDASAGPKRHISYCYATGTVEAKGEAGFRYAGGIAGKKGGTITGCIALNKGGITGASGMTNRVAGNSANACTIADCYASPAINGTWSNIGATNLDGADLTNANFITSNNAFTSDWTTAGNWTFADKDFTNLPTLLTTGLDEDIALKGQPTIKRTDCLGLVLIDKAVTYDATLHKDKSLTIAPAGNLTVNTTGAQVSSLDIQPGGQVTTTTALGVTKTVSTSRTLANQWSTFGAPIKMTLSLTSTAYMLNGYSAAASQEWITPISSASSLSCEASSPYLLASDATSGEASFSSDKGTSIPVSAKPESGSALGNGIFLFRTNPSLSNQEVTNVYILSEDGTRFERKATYTLKPFECYMTANAATTKAVQSLRVAGGAPTGNEPAALPSDAFRLWGADGQLHLEASQPTDVQVYTLTGTLAHSFRLDGSRTLTLGHGIYLVRSNNITYKVSL